MNKVLLIIGFLTVGIMTSCTSGSEKTDDLEDQSDTTSEQSNQPVETQAQSNDTSTFGTWLEAFKADLKDEGKVVQHFDFPIAQAGFTNNMLDDKQLIANHTLDMWRDQFSNSTYRVSHYDGMYLHSYLYESIGASLSDTANVRVIELKPQPIGFLIYVKRNSETWKIAGYENLMIAD